MTAARQFAYAFIGCTLVLGGARGAEVVPAAPLSESPPQVTQPSSQHGSHQGNAAGANSNLKAQLSGRRASPQSVHPGALRPSVAATHPVPIRRPNPGSVASFATGTHPDTQPQASRPGSNHWPTALSVMARSAVGGGPRTQARGTLGGPQNSGSAVRGAVVQATGVQGRTFQGGISGTALRRRF